MRKPLIVGNWKMNAGTPAEAKKLAEEIVSAIGAGGTGVEIALCPPVTALGAVQAALAESGIGLGVQDCFWKESGAYTSQLAPSMLVACGCSYVILGHSETRGRFGVPEPDFTEDVLRHFGESDETVNRKTKAALAAGLTPIVCVGETLAERDAGQTDAVVASQVEGALLDLSPAQVCSLALAYEPVWAIGTGKTCDAVEASRVCGVARARVASLFGEECAGAVRIQYGGSMKPGNAAELLATEHIDGGLIGGASLVASDFAAIVTAAMR